MSLGWRVSIFLRHSSSEQVVDLAKEDPGFGGPTDPPPGIASQGHVPLRWFFK